jgi:hypothetical protein
VARLRGSSIRWVKRPRLESLKSKAHPTVDARTQEKLDSFAIVCFSRILESLQSSRAFRKKKNRLCSNEHAPEPVKSRPENINSNV